MGDRRGLGRYDQIDHIKMVQYEVSATKLTPVRRPVRDGNAGDRRALSCPTSGLAEVPCCDRSSGFQAYRVTLARSEFVHTPSEHAHLRSRFACSRSARPSPAKTSAPRSGSRLSTACRSPPRAAPHRRGHRDLLHPARRRRGDAGAGAAELEAVPGLGAQGRRRGTAGAHRGRAGPRRGPRLRARLGAPGAHPHRAPPPLAGGR